MKTSLRKILIGSLVGLVGLCLAAVLLVGALLVLRPPSITALVPETPIIVTLTQPPNGVILSVGIPYRVTAKTVSEVPVRLMELWVNGSLIGNIPAEEKSPGSAQATWIWAPEREGDYLISVRATDSRGRLAQSQTIQVDATMKANAFAMAPYRVEDGDTLEDLAVSFGSSSDDIIEYNSDLNPTDPLVPGQEISIPVPLPDSGQGPVDPPEIPSLPPDPSTEAEPPPNPIVFNLNGLLSKPGTSPQSPDLFGAVSGCNVELRIDDRADNEAGFFLYRHNPNRSEFERLATLGAKEGMGQISYIDENLFGSYAYYVAAFNSAGETPGGQLKIEVEDPTCGSTDWVGIRIVDGKLEIPQAMDLVYLYLSVNGGSWQRIPSNPESYIPPQDDIYNLSSYLAEVEMAPPGSEISISLEAWGWSGDTLIELGTGRGNLKQADGSAQAKWPWEWTQLTGTWGTRTDIDQGVAAFGDKVKIDYPREVFFDWSTGSPNAANGRWQVSLFPFPSHSDPSPAGLVAHGDVQGNQGVFPINFETLIATKSEPQVSESPTPEPSDGGSQFRQWRFGYKSGQQVSSIPTFPEIIPQWYYVRILPMEGDKLVGVPSNPVIVHYGSIEPPENIFDVFPDGPLYQARIVDFTPPEFQDPNRWGCVVVTGHDEEYPPLYPLPIGAELCPESFKGGSSQGFGDFLADLGEFLEGAINWISEAYSDIKNAVIDLAMQALPFCDALGVEDECRMAVEAGINAGLASLGIPPDLPNFDQLVDAGKGYIVDLAVEQAIANSPVPCPDACEDELRKNIRNGLDQGLDAVANSSQAASCVSEDIAHQHGREPYCPPAGNIVKPATNAINRPPLVTIEIKRRPEVPDPKGFKCTLGVSMIIEKDYPGGLEGPFPVVQEVPAQHVVANLYEDKFLPLVEMELGETMSLSSAFDKGRHYLLPWTSHVYQGTQAVPDWRMDWFYMVQDSQATITAGDFGINSSVYQCVISDQWVENLP